MLKLALSQLTPARIEGGFPLSKPEDLTDEQCGTLHVLPTTSCGMPSLLSEWTLTPEQIQQIAEDGKVYLSVMTLSHPPVMLYVNGSEEVKPTVIPYDRTLPPEWNDLRFLTIPFIGMCLLGLVHLWAIGSI